MRPGPVDSEEPILDSAWVLLLIAALLVAANALFVAAEFSLITVDRTAVEAQAEQDRRAGRVLSALRSLSTQLSGAQLGITITSLVVGFLAEPSLATLLSGPLEALGLSSGAVTAVSVALALAIATGFQMVLGELVPKNWALAEPMTVARAVTPAHLAFTRAARPLIRFLNGSANRLVRAVGVEPIEELPSARSALELLSLVRRSAHTGTLDQPVASLLDRSLRFNDRIAADVLTPRTQLHVIDESAPVGSVIETVRATGHARFPVTGPGGLDDVAGVVDLRRALRVDPADAGSVQVREVMDPPLVVLETMPVDDLLRVLRSRGHLAIVTDEYGGTAGVVSLEDLVEELVGEVQDETDAPEVRIRRLRDGSMLLSGLLRPDEARDVGVPTADDPAYETLGGLAMAALGSVPQTGDWFEIDCWTLRVRRMDGRRVEVLHAEPPGQVPDE